MRDAISGAWVYTIVIVFMMVLIAFVSISINYGSAYRLKTDLITIVEQYQGVNSGSVAKIQSAIKADGYRAKIKCKKKSNQDLVGILDGTARRVSTGAPKQNVCITRELVDGQYYYDISVGFYFSLPVVGDIFTFRVKGETNGIQYITDDYFTTP